MRILILGAGGIGGYFGGRLLEAGADVTFLVRPGRAAQLANDGLIIESPLGSVRRGNVPAVTSVSEHRRPDIVILACKAYGLDAALQAIAPGIDQGTVILPLLNGLAHLAAIEQRFPAATVWGGLAHIGVTLDPDGTVRHLNTHHGLKFGTWPDKPAPAHAARLADEFAAALDAGAVDGRHSARIGHDMWEKFVFLTALAAGTCLMRASVGTIVATPGGRDLMLQFLNEATAVAAAEGFTPDPRLFEQYRNSLTEQGSSSTASMLRDIERGGPTEAEHILGDMVARAQRVALVTPALDIALTHLQAYEINRATKAAI